MFFGCWNLCTLSFQHRNPFFTPLNPPKKKSTFGVVTCLWNILLSEGAKICANPTKKGLLRLKDPS